jgi:hypothetical protein
MAHLAIELQIDETLEAGQRQNIFSQGLRRSRLIDLQAALTSQCATLRLTKLRRTRYR